MATEPKKRPYQSTSLAFWRPWPLGMVEGSRNQDRAQQMSMRGAMR